MGVHQRLLSTQFLARALQPDHPSHAFITRPSGRRNMKQTLRPKVFEEVRPYLHANGLIAPGMYSSSIKSIHNDVVNKHWGDMREAHKGHKTGPKSGIRRRVTWCTKGRAVKHKRIRERAPAQFCVTRPRGSVNGPEYGSSIRFVGTFLRRLWFEYQLHRRWILYV